MQTEFGVPGHVTKMLQAENGLKMDDFKQYISVNTDFDGKWFVLFEHTINCLSFGNVRLLQPEYYFSFLSFYFILFSFFSSPAIYY